jgi:DtxR family Mn-dependent transcriptional regulator
MTREQSASMEDYLEAVEMLRAEGGAVRVKEISALLGVKMPSVTAAMKRLSDEKLVVHEKYGRVRLTRAGKKAAKDVFRRHEVLRRFLVGILDIDPQTAAEDACRMEHTISAHTLERLAKFLSFVESSPRGKIQWLGGYRRYLEGAASPGR